MHEREVLPVDRQRKKDNEVATFRYGLISRVISAGDLSRGEQALILREVASKKYRIPHTTRTTVSVRTLERYLQRYRSEGLSGLKPRARQRAQRIDERVLDEAVRLRRENQSRSVDRIITILEKAGMAPRGYLKRSTVYDHLARHGLTRPQRQGGTYGRFAARHRNQRWLGDSHHLLYLPGPDGIKRKVFLVAWMDDFSRLITHGEIYTAERLPMVEDSLKKAIMKHGLPTQAYVDNGSMYSALHFSRILGHLGIHLSHSRPYRAQGRGKIEKFFALVQSGFTSEIHVMLAGGREITLPELNQYFEAWLKEYYHERVHSSTKQKPILRFGGDTTPIRTIDLEQLNDAFKLEATRKVDKTGVFSLEGTDYQADLPLSGKKVLVRYDPYDPGPVEVWLGDRRCPDASPLKVPVHSSRRKLHEETPEAQPTGLNFVDLMARQQEERRREERVRFSSLGRGED